VTHVIVVVAVVTVTVWVATVVTIVLMGAVMVVVIVGSGYLDEQNSWASENPVSLEARIAYTPPAHMSVPVTTGE
jgi:hypothetical protein